MKRKSLTEPPAAAEPRPRGRPPGGPGYGGRPPGGPGYGGRPRGIEMPCGWGCGARLTADEMRAHFTRCPRRPATPQE